MPPSVSRFVFLSIDIINVTLRTYRKYQLNKHEKNGKIRIDFYR